MKVYRASSNKIMVIIIT